MTTLAPGASAGEQSPIKWMAALQKGVSHREGVKDAKIFKKAVKDLKSFEI